LSSSSPESATSDVDDSRRARAEEERRSCGHEVAMGGMKWGARVSQGAGGCGHSLYSRCRNGRIQRLGGGHPTVGWEAGRVRELGFGRLGRHCAWGRATFGPTCIESCLGSARWAEVAVQALKGRRARPVLGTIDRASGQVRAMLFRDVLHVANRARPIWNTIPEAMPSRRTSQLGHHDKKASACISPLARCFPL
jgi:hypothetical protein